MNFSRYCNVWFNWNREDVNKRCYIKFTNYCFCFTYNCLYIATVYKHSDNSRASYLLYLRRMWSWIFSFIYTLDSEERLYSIQSVAFKKQQKLVPLSYIWFNRPLKFTEILPLLASRVYWISLNRTNFFYYLSVCKCFSSVWLWLLFNWTNLLRICPPGGSERSPFSRKRRSSSGGGSLKAGAGGSGGSPKLSPHHPSSDHSHHHHHHDHHPHPHHHHHGLARRLTRSLSESNLFVRRRSGRGRSHGEYQVWLWFS